MYVASFFISRKEFFFFFRPSSSYLVSHLKDGSQTSLLDFLLLSSLLLLLRKLQNGSDCERREERTQEGRKEERGVESIFFLAFPITQRFPTYLRLKCKKVVITAILGPIITFSKDMLLNLHTYYSKHSNYLF